MVEVGTKCSGPKIWYILIAHGYDEQRIISVSGIILIIERSRHDGNERS